MAGPSSIIGASVVRFARLDADGTPDFDNPVGGFALCGGISKFEYDFEIEAGADIFEEDAAGNACVTRKRPDRVKRVTFTLTLCRSDYRVDEIIGVADSIINGADVVGRGIKNVTGCAGTSFPNGVSLELWSEQWDCDVPLAGAPYMRTVIPRAYFTPKGHTRENGVALPVYMGYGVPNPNYGDGPFGDLDLLTGLTGSYSLFDIDDPYLPSCPDPVGYINVPGSAS